MSHCPLIFRLSMISALFLLCIFSNAGNAASGEARVGGHFALTDTHGRAVTDTDYRGRLMLVYLGYSHCPDICPMTLSVLSRALRDLGEAADQVSVIFISLDPERDTPQALASFLAPFDPRVIGLTGDKAEIDRVVKLYAGYYRKNAPQPSGSYVVDHSGLLYLMDSKGTYVAHFPADAQAADIVKAVRDHL